MSGPQLLAVFLKTTINFKTTIFTLDFYNQCLQHFDLVIFVVKLQNKIMKVLRLYDVSREYT